MSVRHDVGKRTRCSLTCALSVSLHQISLTGEKKNKILVFTPEVLYLLINQGCPTIPLRSTVPSR